ncbi:hypothetical protein [Nocardioides convexus]|uniref:hypothetical protein n=1 Tax=Nocardioides convexus TaxID=2712224 RepID=UPI0024185D1D|nr:hypothetical protein [Nocardioides convexus]
MTEPARDRRERRRLDGDAAQGGRLRRTGRGKVTLAPGGDHIMMMEPGETGRGGHHRHDHPHPRRRLDHRGRGHRQAVRRGRREVPAHGRQQADARRSTLGPPQRPPHRCRRARRCRGGLECLRRRGGDGTPPAGRGRHDPCGRAVPGGGDGTGGRPEPGRDRDPAAGPPRPGGMGPARRPGRAWPG